MKRTTRALWSIYAGRGLSNSEHFGALGTAKCKLNCFGIYSDQGN